jgi:1,4-dihydroxy-2-naphthoate octaprenyltransferase
MTAKPIMRDERTVATENASYRWAYLAMSFGLLVSTAYRSFVRNESAWDLLALVILGGAVATFYQGGRRTLSRRWAVASAAAVLLAVVLGVVLALIRR